jgi:hypothetical protein
MTESERAAARRRRMVTNRARSHDEAEDWDLRFWQSLSPQQRLSALVAIHRDVEKVRAGRSGCCDGSRPAANDRDRDRTASHREG